MRYVFWLCFNHLYVVSISGGFPFWKTANPPLYTLIEYIDHCRSCLLLQMSESSAEGGKTPPRIPRFSTVYRVDLHILIFAFPSGRIFGKSKRRKFPITWVLNISPGIPLYPNDLPSSHLVRSKPQPVTPRYPLILPPVHANQAMRTFTNLTDEDRCWPRNRPSRLPLLCWGLRRL